MDISFTTVLILDNKIDRHAAHGFETYLRWRLTYLENLHGRKPCVIENLKLSQIVTVLYSCTIQLQLFFTHATQQSLARALEASIAASTIAPTPVLYHQLGR
jgi:hypothetical protein